MPRKKKVNPASQSAFRNIGLSYSLNPPVSPSTEAERRGLPAELQSMVMSYVSAPHADIIAEFNRRRQVRDEILEVMWERLQTAQIAYDEFTARLNNPDLPQHVREYYTNRYVFRLANGEDIFNYHGMADYIGQLRDWFQVMMTDIDQATPSQFEGIMRELNWVVQEVTEAERLLTNASQGIDVMTETARNLGEVQPKLMRRYGF
jgi:hypothetical protein